jgi:hypothetical protein
MYPMYVRIYVQGGNAGIERGCIALRAVPTSGGPAVGVLKNSQAVPQQ